MSKTPNYHNAKISRKLISIILATEKTLPKLEAARDGELFRKSEMKEIIALYRKFGDAIQFFDSQIQLTETKKETK